MRIVVLERNSVGEDVSVDCFQDLGELTIYHNTEQEQIAERIKDADIVVSNKSKLNEETLKDVSNLKLICQLATGYDNVDLAYCKSRGIRVTNAVNYSTASVAQHTFALLFYLLENLRYYDDYVKDGFYEAQDRFTHFSKVFRELEGKTWGIVGMGHIGRKVANIAQMFGCCVIFYSASGTSTCTEYERVEFDRLLSESDIISLHCPLSERTRNLFDYSAIQKMKKSAYLINVARGPVVNGADLAQALEEGLIAGAGLDVLEQEPIAADNPLKRIKDSGRLLITPHMAWASVEARRRVVDEVYENIKAFLDGKERNIV